MTFEESEKRAKKFGGKLYNRQPHSWGGYESVTWEFPSIRSARDFASHASSIYSPHVFDEFRRFVWVTVYLPLAKEQ